MPSKIGIQRQLFSKNIEVGRLNRAQTMFIGEKQDVTDQCIVAVAQFVEQNYDGGAVITCPSAGLKVEVTVTKIDKEADQ